MSTPINVVITGAAGQIGYAIMFRIAKGDVFGCNQKINLHLLEIEPALPALNGCIMELQDCAFPNLAGVFPTANPEEAFKDADACFLIGAFPRKDGMDRSALLQKNGGIFRVQGEAIGKFAKKTVKVLVVGNPANTNCLICQHYAGASLKNENFSAMTRLDHNRMLGEIAARLNVTTDKVKKVIVWGNHSNTQVDDASHATVELADGVKAVYGALPQADLEGEFAQKIATRGGAVIKARGASSAASAANAAITQMRDWWCSTPEGDWVSMAIPVPDDEPYGIKKGIIYSFPVVVKQGVVEVVKGLECNAHIQAGMKKTEDELIAEKQAAYEALNIQ
uniref:malate dehydrogenase n=1 Tax=Hypotrichomonas acosta TaxID=5735 RepID=Q9GSY4_9EUKA|nr:putative cytosolic malate dehydrogenase [Hypotrichomonas acosta]